MSRKSSAKYSDDGEMKWCIGNEHNGFRGHWVDASYFYSENKNQCEDCVRERTNNNPNQRVRDAYRAQEAAVGYLTDQDDLTVEDVDAMLVQQGNRCPCGKIFHSASDYEIAHQQSKKHLGPLTRKNLVLLCHDCNKRGKQGAEDHYYEYWTTNMSIPAPRISVDKHWWEFWK